MFNISQNTEQNHWILSYMSLDVYEMTGYATRIKSKARLYAELMFNHKLIQFLFAKASLKKSVSNLLNQVKYMLYFYIQK